MANCSIPNSTPAIGRISTPSSKQLRKQNSATQVFVIRCSTLDVGRSTFSSYGRVKGGWWPSRSSKPPSLRKWRGRFDSYPLRLFLLIPSRFAVRSVPTTARRRLQQPQSEGGEPDVA